MATDAPTILWTDLQVRESESDIYTKCSGLYHTHRVTQLGLISAAIQKIRPRLLCFEYDFPNLLGLRVLRQTKLACPSLPILMLTEHHSETLAVWAYRARVWDYLVKPVSIETMSERIDALLSLGRGPNVGGPRAILATDNPIPVEARFSNPSNGRQMTKPVATYIDAHYPENISLQFAAQLCGLGRFQFSRRFKSENGISFREFLIRYRIGKAREFLKNPHITVTDAAFAVGFNDLSFFSKVFRRYIGASPSLYCRKIRHPSRRVG